MTVEARVQSQGEAGQVKEQLPMGVPNFVLLIPDNNRTWARAHGLSVRDGYNMGARKLIEVARAATHIGGLDHLAANLASRDNIVKRPAGELKDLWNAVKENMIDTGLPELIDQGVRVRVVGNLEGVREDIKKGFKDLSEQSKDNTGLALTFILGYDSMQEKRDAFKAARKEASWRKRVFRLRHRPRLTPELIESHKYLQAAGLPDTINAVIRTGPEERTSGIFPDPIAKAELLFVKDITWPEFGAEQFEQAIAQLASRKQKGGA